MMTLMTMLSLWGFFALACDDDDNDADNYDDDNYEDDNDDNINVQPPGSPHSPVMMMTTMTMTTMMMTITKRTIMTIFITQPSRITTLTSLKPSLSSKPLLTC